MYPAGWSPSRENSAQPMDESDHAYDLVDTAAVTSLEPEVDEDEQESRDDGQEERRQVGKKDKGKEDEKGDQKGGKGNAFARLVQSAKFSTQTCFSKMFGSQKGSMRWDDFVKVRQLLLACCVFSFFITYLKEHGRPGFHIRG